MYKNMSSVLLDEFLDRSAEQTLQSCRFANCMQMFTSTCSRVESIPDLVTRQHATFDGLNLVLCFNSWPIPSSVGLPQRLALGTSRAVFVQ